MNNATRVYKSKFNGWTAHDELDLGNNRVLSIVTCKRNGGAITTHASVATRSGAFLHHVMFQDYSATVAQGGTRATEKAIIELHQSVNVPAVIEVARKHYNA